MSGGHYDYKQDQIKWLADDLEADIDNFKDTYSPETIQQFKHGLNALKLAYCYAQRIDWLLSGDDAEDTFHTRLNNDLKNIT